MKYFFAVLVGFSGLCTFLLGGGSDYFLNKDLHPNVVILLADDLGYADLNSYSGIPHTPNIDALARNGLKFTDFYAPAPNCSPARAGLLTGRNPNRVGVYSYRMPNHSMHLRDNELTIAEFLKKAGYQTAMFGKWHLSNLVSSETTDRQPSPGDQGFDFWMATENNAHPSHFNVTNFVKNGERSGPVKGFSSHVLVREANQWLEENRNNASPFFLYIPFHEVHKKIASPDSLIRKYSDKENATYHANIENMDNAVGKLINKLKELGEFKDTIILFSSDNGSYRLKSNGNLRGYKGETFEGGVRVPGIIHWPEKIATGRSVSSPAGLIDILPTISKIIDTPLPQDRKYDGVSLVPILNDYIFKRSRPLWWFFYRASPELGLRDGKYVLNAYTGDSELRTHYFSDKAMSFIRNIHFNEYKLYNITKDPLQRNDLSSIKPTVLDSLKKKAEKFRQEFINEGPYWPNLPKYDDNKAQEKWNYIRNKENRWDQVNQ